MRATETHSPFAGRKERPLMVMDVADWDRRAPESGGALARRLERWTREARWQLLAFHKGRIVKRMDNGVMMEFADARSCLQAAFALARLADDGVPRAQRLFLRAAAHLANCIPLEGEAAGPDVELVSALASLARPGEILMSAELRHRLADGLDADFEDLGHRRVDPSARLVRLFRAHPRKGDIPDWAMLATHDLRPGLAVIPFEGEVPPTKHWMLGGLIAEGVIARLSRSIGLRVISGHSTSALRGRGGLGEIERHLGAKYALSGSYRIRGKRLIVDAELAETRSHALLWRGQFQRTVGDVFQEDSELMYMLAYAVAMALGSAQVGRPLARSLPRLDSSALLLDGIAMTHSDSADISVRGRETLAQLTVRHPDSAIPKAWLGLWYALNVIKGKSDDVAADTRRAREQTARALEAESENSMALAVEGYIRCQLLGDPQQATSYLNAAIEANPNEPMAWLFKSLASCMWNSSSVSVTEAHIARALSPVDPLQYFFDMLMGNALLADHRHEQAIACLRRSLRVCRHHAPTLRLLLTAQAELGSIDEGHETLGKLRAEVPELTVSSYLRMGSTDSPMRQRGANAFRQLGLPEN